jgi:hypothetical protein
MTINLKVQQGSIVLPEELHLPDGTEVQLVVVALPGQQDRSHRFGFAKGKFKVADDFDEPLEDFAPYT